MITGQFYDSRFLLKWNIDSHLVVIVGELVAKE
jgi:hypothetical protein